MSEPRVSRTVVGTPRARNRRTNSRSTPGSGVELVTEEVSTPTLVIHVADQGVLDADPPTGHREISVCRVDSLIDAPPGVDRDELVAKRVVGRMQRQCQGDRNALCGKLVDGWDQPNGGHGDA